jgi:hypothetical protein
LGDVIQGLVAAGLGRDAAERTVAAAAAKLSSMPAESFYAKLSALSDDALRQAKTVEAAAELGALYWVRGRNGFEPVSPVLRMRTSEFVLYAAHCRYGKASDRYRLSAYDAVGSPVWWGSLVVPRDRIAPLDVLFAPE